MLTPEEIQSREFLVSLRGYDRDEVHAFLGRVAEQLAQTEAKATQLQQRLDRLKAQQPTAAAAAEPAPAAQQTGTVEPSAMFAEIGKETQRILEAAQEAGQQIQRKARQEADRDLQAARQQAAKLIAEGERRREHIERVVSELEQARAAMSVQLRGVGRTIEQTLRELAPSEQTSTIREAMGAQAARDQRPAAPPAAQLPAESESGDDDDSEGEPAPAPEPEPEPAADEPTADAPAPAQPAADEPGTGDAAVGATDETAEAPDAEGADAGAVEQAAVEAAPAPATADDAAAVTAGAPVIADDEGQEPLAAAAPEATETTVAEESGDGQGPGEEPADTPAASDDQSDEPAPDAEAAGPEAAEEPAAPAEPDAPGTTEPAMPPPSTAASGRNDPQGLRAAALSPLHPKLVRKVKRELQEIQNIALDKLRRARGEGDVDDFLPSEQDTEGLGEGSGDLLLQAWEAGVASASVLADQDLGSPDEGPDLADAFREDAAGRVRSGLTSTLRMGLSASEGQQALSDRVGAVFSEFKGAQAEELAATHLIRAYELGLLAAWSYGGIGARQWVLGREPRCPEGRCRYNDQGGPVAVGESFASGHDVPPVHVGCTCTTVPAEE